MNARTIAEKITTNTRAYLAGTLVEGAWREAQRRLWDAADRRRCTQKVARIVCPRPALRTAPPR